MSKKKKDLNQHGSALQVAVLVLVSIGAFVIIIQIFPQEDPSQLNHTFNNPEPARTRKVIDYQVDDKCKHLNVIRPSGVFFVDGKVMSAKSPEGFNPSFQIGSYIQSVAGHMGGDTPYYKLIQEHLHGKEGGIAFDIGANQGFYTYFLASLGIEVHSFEVDAANFRALQHGTLFNPKDVGDRVNLYSMGLSDRVSRFSLSGGMYTGFLKGGDGMNGGPILAVSFDCFAHHLDRDLSKGITFVKLDVEGFEISVLKGAHNSLFKHRIGAMFMEVGPARWSRSQIDHTEGVKEMKALAVRFEQSYIIVRQQGTTFWKTCPPALGEMLTDKSPRLIEHVIVYKLQANEMDKLLEEMKAKDYDCNFWFTNN